MSLIHGENGPEMVSSIVELGPVWMVGAKQSIGTFVQAPLLGQLDFWTAFESWAGRTLTVDC